MERVRTIRSTCNCYAYNSILIDAGAEVGAAIKTQNPRLKTLVLTHEHCDHFAGMDEVDCDSIAASKFCADVVNGKKDEYGLCSHLSLGYPKRKVDRVLKDGDNIEGDGCNLKVIETPGHAKGAICLFDEDAKILFSGDTVFPDNDMPRTDLKSSEPQMLKDSYEKLASLDIESIYPGHGKEIMEKNYIRKIMKSLDGTDE